MKHSNYTVLALAVLAVAMTGIQRAAAQSIYAPYTFTTLAGLAGSPGSADGTGSAARFSAPFGVAVDSAGNAYVADTGNDAIRKVTPTGAVTTLAGGSYGSADGTGSAAGFFQPSGVAVDSAGNVYVADQYNHTIRKVTPAAVVTTLAGVAGHPGNLDGTGSAARFNWPDGVAVDSAGSVYVADTDNSTIRKVTPAGVVTTLAGMAGNPGSADGTGSAARFFQPGGVAVDSAGNVYVADSGNDAIRRGYPGPPAAIAITFSPLTNSQIVPDLSALRGSVTDSFAAVATVSFAIEDLTANAWWNGTTFQSTSSALPAALSGTSWSPAPGVALPALSSGRRYLLTATATDADGYAGSTNITVQANTVPPVVWFSPLTNNQIVPDLSALGGSVTDIFNAVATMTFSIQESRPPGRWWNGAGFQSGSVSLPAAFSGTNWFPAPGVALPALNSGQSYQLSVSATDTTGNTDSTNIIVQAPITALTWDPGTNACGSALLQAPNPNGGNYLFKITTQTPSNGVWRTGLQVNSGSGSVFMSLGTPPTPQNYSYPTSPGAPGFVLDLSAYQFSPAQDWYILVNATPKADWALVSGDIFVYDLGALTNGPASSTNVMVCAEGMVFFKTTIPTNTRAWQLWLNGATNARSVTNALYVKRSLAGTSLSYEKTQTGQMLVVPPYLDTLTFNGDYFVSVPGRPRSWITLNSLQQAPIDLPFNSLTSLSFPGVTNPYPYTTYRVSVPVQQIAWQVNLNPSTGSPSLALRRNIVPNEFDNDAYSEAPPGVGASMTLVPPVLSDGTFYITVYGYAPFSGTLTNGNPKITHVPYHFTVINDETNRVGWRYYGLTNIDLQLGSLGWELLLSSNAPGTEIAIRRNAVPGQWITRTGGSSAPSQLYADQYSLINDLQQPGHQADIWYIGIYNPGAALGPFVLTGQALTNTIVPFDGLTSGNSVANWPPGVWRYFQIAVPLNTDGSSFTNLLGWDIRLTNVTAGLPRFVVRRDLLPGGLGTDGQYGAYWGSLDGLEYLYPEDFTNWPSGYQWLAGGDWTGEPLNPDGSNPDVGVLAMGVGNPAQPGAYYIGVYDGNNASSYTLMSRGMSAPGTTNYSIPVKDLGFVDSATATQAPREADYYHVVITNGTPSWRVKLAPTAGDALLLVQQHYLPNVVSDGSALPNYADGFVDGGIKLEKAGNEHYLLLPENGQTNIPPGDYYLGVVSQGVNPGGQDIGSNTTSYVLSSLGPLPVTNLGTVFPTNDLIVNLANVEGGDVLAFQFTVPSNLWSSIVRADLTVTLSSATGGPLYSMASGTNIPSPDYNFYAAGEGGWPSSWKGTTNDLINPVAGVYTLTLTAAGGYFNGWSVPDATLTTLRVHVEQNGPTPLAFDGPANSVTTNAPAGQWRYFQMSVPLNTDGSGLTNLLGWDIRLTNVTAGLPQFVVRRDQLPDGLGTDGQYGAYWGSLEGLEALYPEDFTNWPSGYQWLAGGDWTGEPFNPDGSNPDVGVLAMGVGNPVQPGTYYIGVYDGNNASSYTLMSRGMSAPGTTNYSIPVKDLGFVDSATATQAPREADYYHVVITSGTPSWRVKLAPTVGDALLLVQQDYLPNVVSDGSALPNFNYGFEELYGGIKLEKAGNEHYLLLPGNGQTNIPPGDYYLGVVSQGVNPSGQDIGSNTTSYVLSCLGSLPVTDLGAVGSSDLVITNALEAADVAAYHFVNVPKTVAAMEVRLENVAGNPYMYLLNGTAVPGFSIGYSYAGGEGGQRADWSASTLITLPNAAAGTYTLTIAAAAASGVYPDAAYTLRIHQVVPPPINLAPSQNANGGTNAVSGSLADGESAYYQVSITNLDGAPLLGWNLDLIVTNGAPEMRVRPGLLPDDTCDTTAFASGSVIVAPPYLTNGAWYVEVRGNGASTFSLVSSAITTNTLTRQPWVMPAAGDTTVAAAGLSMPVFGDTGVSSSGTNLPGDQGVDLANGQYHFYAVVVPDHNAGLLRTELEAISGNPNLYVRTGAAPTLYHYSRGSCPVYYGEPPLVDRQLSASADTEYGNWVPLDGQTETQLTPGLWVLAVQATGSSNARYRLILSSGNVVTNGLVEPLPLDGSVTNSNSFAGHDWQYYRVDFPSNAPATLTVNWTRSQGDAHLFIRDTVPPGDGASGSYYNYNSSWGDAVTWASDAKNKGPYPNFPSPGAAVLTVPPLRPGAIYYLGFWSDNDTTISVSCSTNGAVDLAGDIPFYAGGVGASVPANSALLYRIEVPAEATRLKFYATNAAGLILTLEQGTVALPGGPAHWKSSGANAGLDQPLGSVWPWLPGYAYYLTVTNTSGSAEPFSLNLALPADLAPISLGLAAGNAVTAASANPVVALVWAVTNQGPGSATGSSVSCGAWYDEIFCLTNPVLDAAAVPIWAQAEYGPVPAGGSYSGTNNVTLPVSQSGTYYLIFQANYDAACALYESNLSNNVLVAPFTFTLGAPPRITAQPAGQSVRADATAVFAVAATGTLPLAYQWQLNGANLTDNGRIIGSLSNLLSIIGAQVGDAGSYQVIVTNLYGSATSDAALLTVTTPTTLSSPFWLGGGQFRLTVTGSPNTGFDVLFSANLTSWALLTTVTNRTGSDTFVLPAAGGRAGFYRLRQH